LPDGKNWACVFDDERDKWHLAIDGRYDEEEGYRGIDPDSVQFSPDGTKCAFGAVSDEYKFVWVCKEVK